MARAQSHERSPFAVVADLLTQVRVMAAAASSEEALDLFDVARTWPHYVEGPRIPRAVGGLWIVEVQSRRRLSKADLRDWRTQAEALRAKHEREAARLRREEAEATAKREEEGWASRRRAAAAVAAAQAAAPPGPRAAYVYSEAEDRAALVPIAARAGALVVRKREKGSIYTFTHEPTGLDLAAPEREVVKTKRRAVELLERAARPAVLAALDAALARGATRETYQQFYAAWAADPAHAATARPAQEPERSVSPFATAAGALAAAMASCTRCHGSGTVQEGEIAVFCTCPLGRQQHDRDLALAWAPAETKRIVQFLDQRVASEGDASAQRALKAAARALQENGHVGDKAATYLLRAARRGSAAARGALRTAVDELVRGAHLPPAPLPATAEQIAATYRSRDGTTAMQAIDALETALVHGDPLPLHGPLRVGFRAVVNDALTRGSPEVWQTDEDLYALRQTIATTPTGLTGPSTTANTKLLKRLRGRERSLLDELLAGRARHAAALRQRAPRVLALYSAAAEAAVEPAPKHAYGGAT
jgi:hypothetical protein